MTKFAFEGGHREGPDFLQHLEDRRKGMPRQNASLAASYTGPDDWGGTSAHSAVPLPAYPEPDAKVYRMDSHGLGLAGTGLVGEIPHALLCGLFYEGVIPPSERRRFEVELKKCLDEQWGGGRYRVVSDAHGDYEVVVAGPSKPIPGVSGQGDPVEAPKKIEVSDTVWLELSRGGPYKVVGRYNHPQGASVPAHHPHDAPNTYEKIRVTEDLWLCQDAAGVVHILAGGSLTLTPPASRFSKVTRAASWCWHKREAVLWAAIASMTAALAL